MSHAQQKRMMHLGAFVHETGQHVAAWRHPGAHHRSGTSFAEMAETAAAGRAGPVRPAVPGRLRRRQPRGQRRGARPHGQGGEVRADDGAVRPGGRHPPPRPGRHLDHDLQRALHAGPPVRLARPDQRRPRRLEPGHLEQRAGCAELQPRRAPRPCRPLRSRPRVRRRGQRPVGQLGRGRLHPRPGIGTSSSIRPRCMC